MLLTIFIIMPKGRSFLICSGGYNFKTFPKRNFTSGRVFLLKKLNFQNVENINIKNHAEKLSKSLFYT